MPATRSLLLIAIGLYAWLPLPWIVWRPESLFYNFDVDRLGFVALAGALFTAAWCIGERVGPNRPWFAADTADSARWPVGTLAVIAGLVVSATANLALFSMGALTIDEVTGRVRVPVLTTLGSAHIFSLIYSACILLCTPTGRRSRAHLFLAVAATIFTVTIGLVEGRRTGVILPFVVYFALACITGRRRLLLGLLYSLPVFALLVGLTTYARMAGEDGPDLDESVLLIAGDAVVGRLGNALLILDPVLEHMHAEREPFDPQTLRSIASIIPVANLIFTPPFDTGFGNEFGRQLGLLPDVNDFTGINAGWIGELILYGGLPAVVAGGFCLAALASCSWRLLPLDHPAGLFLRVMVVIFVISGFQMEVAFPIASLIRATVIALLMAALERFVRQMLAPA